MRRTPNEVSAVLKRREMRGTSVYRFGFNGKEKDENQEWGDDTHYDYGFRIYNPRIGRFLSVDPLTDEYPFYSPYHFAGNMPTSAVDLDGREPEVLNGKIIGYRVQAGQGPTQIAQDINDPQTMERYGYCLHQPVDWQQVVYENIAAFPEQNGSNNGPGWLNDRNNINDPEYKRLNLDIGQKLRVTGDCDDCGIPTPEEPRHETPKIDTDDGPGFVRRIWDSHLVRGITGDAVSFGAEVNSFAAAGVTNTPAGGLLMLHGPEAFTLHSFSDVGVGVGFEFSGGGFINRSWFLTSADNISSDDFGGLRTNVSVDVGEGVIGGINVGINNPQGKSPWIFTAGFSLGKGVTTPFGVGGNVNEGTTIMHSQLNDDENQGSDTN